MSFGRIIDVFASIVTVAMVFVLVSHTQTAAIITAWGNAFAGSLSAAMGGGGTAATGARIRRAA
jgi:hypothetical protein